MKRIKKSAAVCVCFCLTLLMAASTNVSASAESEQSKSNSKWETQKSITISQNDVRYYAYLSKDKKESWIYKIDPIKKVKKLVIPKKIKAASVTRIGFGAELYADGSDYFVSVFGDSLEPWHNLYGTHLKKKNAITQIVFPKTVKDIEIGAFSGMKRLEKVHITKSIKDIGKEALTAKKIRNVSLDGDNPVYAMKNHCIYTKKDGTLVAVLVKGLKIQIPNSVKIMGENVSVMGKLEADDDEIVDDEILTRLVSLPNVIITSHQAFLTREALENIASVTYENITQYFESNKLPNEITG